MYFIQVSKPTRVKPLSTPFKVFEGGKLFYSSEWVNNFRGWFTLPKGEYYINCDYRILKGFKKPNIRLPKYERNLKHDFSKFKIIFRENPNKCTIYHKKQVIVFDNSFRSKPKYILHFVLFHEVGHNFYSTEWKADYYAVKRLLEMGYTPIQIAFAPFQSLSAKQIARKQKAFKILINNYNNDKSSN